MISSAFGDKIINFFFPVFNYCNLLYTPPIFAKIDGIFRCSSVVITYLLSPTFADRGQTLPFWEVSAFNAFPNRKSTICCTFRSLQKVGFCPEIIICHIVVVDDVYMLCFTVVTLHQARNICHASIFYHLLCYRDYRLLF